ncbi:long-chain-fatty-acid--CoA ligase [Corynebacterium bovis]|uniref:long-chain-fatty-acid--CoA ligase n=1 Tax=Corynebacterium bovis TaxID=36808 RepID=UPI00313965E0
MTEPTASAARDRAWLSAYAPWTPPTLDYPDRTLTDLFTATVRDHGDRTATEFFGASLTYRRLGRLVDEAAEGLRQLGVGPGDRVAVILPNCPQHLVVIYAVLSLGATVAEHNPLYTAAELRHPFTVHGATVAVTWDRGTELCRALTRDTPLRTIVTVNVIDDMPPLTRLALHLPVPVLREKRRQLHARERGTLTFRQLLAAGRRSLAAAGRQRPGPGPTPDSEALILFTSGTTGVPKGAPLSHRNIVTNIIQGQAWMPGMDGSRELSILAVLPLFHVYGFTLTAGLGVAAGGTLIMLPSPDPALMTGLLRKRTPTYMPGVPTLYSRVLDAADAEGVDLSGIEFALSGAAALPVPVTRRWEEHTGGRIVEGYGLTETGPVLAANPFTDDRRAGYVGVPFPDTELRIGDPEDLSRTLPDGEPGELLARGPQVFAGYLDLAEEEQPFHDGWFRTGDIAVMEPDGFIRIVSRLKEMIITGGFNVYPAEVEKELVTHPDIARAAVVGVPREDGSEEVTAAVVLAEGVGRGSVDDAALRAWLKERLTPYKVPRRFVVVDDLPSDLIGKVRRREVRDLVTGTADD